MDYVIGWMTVRPGERDEFFESSLEFVRATKAEPGTLFFELHKSSENPDVVVAIEAYVNAEVHEAHVKSAHFAAFWHLFQRYVLTGKFENVTADTSRLDEVRSGA